MAKYVKTEHGYKEIEEVNYNKMDRDNPVGTGSFSMGRKPNTVIGGNSHAEGYWTTASGIYSHAEGQDTTASGSDSHAEGYNTTASGPYSHAEGVSTTASGYVSHAEGIGTTASGSYSHAEGYYTKATGFQSHAEGKYNIEDTAQKYAHIVGNGSSDTSRSNAHTLDWNGVGWFKNSVKVGGSSQDDGAAKTLATTDYVDTTVSTKISGKQDTLIQSGASIGQIAKITAVDSSGKPTAWQAVDMPSGGGGGSAQRVVVDTTLSDSASAIIIDSDSDGNAFRLREAHIVVELPANSENAESSTNVWIFPDSVGSNPIRISGSVSNKTSERAIILNVFAIGNTAKIVSGSLGGNYVYAPNCPVNKLDDFFSYLRIESHTTGNSFAAGTRIVIWGVDA